MGFSNSAFALVLSLLLLVKSSTSLEPNTDAYFLDDFFTKMGYKSISSSSPVCTWTGVSCDSKNTVTGLSLSGLNLTGAIPERTIGKLTNLQHLDLSNNKITNLSDDLWELGTALKSLNLSFNSITGSLSDNIGNFGALERLDLSHNGFGGEVPRALGSIASLVVLNLSYNRFTGAFPEQLFGCKNLIAVDLSNNLLGGSVPDNIGDALKSLKMLNLGGNRFTGRLLNMSGLVSLTYLNLSSNSIQGPVTGAFRDLMEFIDLSNNQFEGHIPSSGNLSTVVYLDLSMNKITGQFSGDLNRYGSLKHLNLAFNKFSVQSFPSLGKLSGMEYLNLSNCNLTGQIPSDFSQLVNLKTLDLSQNYISGQIPDFGVTDLQIIDLSVNNLTGQIPEPLEAKIPILQKFNFSYNNLTVCGPHFSIDDYSAAFVGSRNDCPIAVDPVHTRTVRSRRKRLGLILAVSLSAVCMVLGLVCLFLGLKRRSNKPVEVEKQMSLGKEENNLSSSSGPFAFQTDVKIATSVPVIIFEKPLVNFTFSDLLTATSNFDRGTLLAEGRFGPVYRGFLQGGIQVAVKVLVHGLAMADSDAERELERLGRIKHPNLVPLTGYCLAAAGEQRIAIYEYMENGNLHNLLHDLPLGVQSTEDWSGDDTWEEDVHVTPEGTTTWRFRHKIALGTARALAFLHHGCIPEIVHRDVRASSVFLDDSMEPRLADFGLSMIANTNPDDQNSNSNGSPGYNPPEFSEPGNSSATTKSDVYGFGVVLLELLTGKKPLGDEYPDSKESRLVNWARGMVKMGHGSSIIDPKIRDTGSEREMEEALRIGYLCTADSPAKRPAMQQIVGLLKDIEPKSNKD